MAPVASAQTGGLGRPDLPEQRVSKVRKVTGLGAERARERVAKDRAVNAAQAEKAGSERRAAWPAAGSAKVTPGPQEKAKISPGGLPVTVTRPTGTGGDAAPADAGVTVLDQRSADRLGITGVVLSAQSDAGGFAEIGIDYSRFASAVGGGWATRLELVRLPACALLTPQKADCRTRTPLGSSNSVKNRTVTARIPFGSTAGTTAAGTDLGAPVVLALTAAGAGESAKGTGDYTATELSESASWQAGASSGSFAWSYDFSLPPAAAGHTPPLGLSYDSGNVDGRTATTNNQGSSVGEGFAFTESYVERTYGSCDKDGHDDVFDQCWKYDNARLVLNGKASRLVKDKTGVWRLEGDDASKVSRSTGADNGDDDGEYWTVITGDGTKYVFGLNKLDGAGDQRTDSTWTVPVFGDDPGEPGYSEGSAFADRSLTQAWRWNLDYVVDTHGNAATYWYAKESNHYKKNKASKSSAEYTRGGYLKKIRYGLREGALFTDDADAEVTFDHAERCTASDCSNLTKDTSKNWPDVPFDTICAKDDADCKAESPAFFSRKRLTGINTFSWSASGKKYEPVDSWDFTQKFLDGGDIGDSSDQVLTLQSIKRTGRTGTAIALDPVSFTYQMRPNRVDATDDILPLTRPRLSTITSETGSITTVTLSAPECVRSQVIDAAQDSNTRSCYPQFWNINGAEKASVDWFHKYRVLAVTISDPAGQNDTVENEYAYSGAAWHYSDDPFTAKDERTWSDWRGYRQVTVYSGAKNTGRSKSVSLYMQGMNGDKQKDGTTRSVTVPALTSPALGIGGIEDSDQYAGQLRQSVTYDGTTAISATMNEPWSKETARQDVPDAADHVARYVRTAASTNYTYLTVPKTWRSTRSASTFDDYGMPVTTTDFGDLAVSGDETCTRTWYARNDATGLTSLVSRARTVAKPCTTKETSLDLPTGSATRGDVLSDVATVYDNATATAWTTGQKPTKGDATWTGRAAAYPATATADERHPTSWQKITTTTYDKLGRAKTVTNALGKTGNTTTYTPAEAGPLTKTVVTNAKGQNTATFLDPRRGLPERTYDVNLKLTETAYDALGRMTDVWKPNRIRGSQSPNVRFAYHLSRTKASSVATSTLKADGETYNTSYAVYDALLRPLQSQSPTSLGGRLLTDTRYDSRGLAYETYADIFDSTSTPNGDYTRAEYGEAPTQKETVFDGAGRAVANSLYVYGVKRWTTRTDYTGDSTATTALKGGAATRTITDARGRAVETREYAAESPDDPAYGATLGASYTFTKTAYTPDGLQRSITSGQESASWSYTYDLFGRQVSADDPDKGRTRSEYDALDQVIKVTDSRPKTILTEYDDLGRVQYTWDGEKTDEKLLTSYEYDTVAKGQLTSSTRYVGGGNGQAFVKEVTAYDSLNHPTAGRITLPADDPLVRAGVPATLDFSSHYRIDGTVQTSSEPAVGGLAKETVEYGYNGVGKVTSLQGATGYLRSADYSALGQVQQLTLGTGGPDAKNMYVTNTYEEGTGRLTRSHVTDQTHPYMLQDLNYTQDDAGNVLSISDAATLGGTSEADNQCFAYDGHRRLVEAWTPRTADCATTGRTVGNLDGAAPYWTSYSYTDAGQRKTLTTHSAAGDATTHYKYGTASGQPHPLVETTGPKTETYTYDSVGNTTGRPGTQARQTLTWNTEGKPATATEPAANGKPARATSYLYDADGQLLIRRNTSGDGDTVLYLGSTEVRLTTKGASTSLAGTRYYAAAGQTLAVRTARAGAAGSNLCYLAADHHGTSSLAVDATTQAVTKRHTTPFGDPRGTEPTSWPDDKAFLGKPADTTTGLTHIGAREYDPGIGQFLSVDPVLSVDQHQSLNGYSYANQSPATNSDPTGLACYGGNHSASCNPNGQGGDLPGSDNCYGGNHSASCNPNGQGGALPGSTHSDRGSGSGRSGGSGGTARLGGTPAGSNTPPLLLGPAPDTALPCYQTSACTTNSDLGPVFQKLAEMFKVAKARQELEAQCDKNPRTKQCIDLAFEDENWEDMFTDENGVFNACTSYGHQATRCADKGNLSGEIGPPWLGKAVGHGSVGVAYCFVICIGVSQAGDGHRYFNIGAVGFGGRSVSGGAATAKSGDQSWFSVQGCASLGPGACGTIGTRSDPNAPTWSTDQSSTGDYWYGGSVAPGIGWFVGLNISIPIP
ncbi:RHS repeat-associated core domain-containing protein [Streptomyces sp. NBC_01618]|uniref:RHS repeat-associated core domain-containing protein n=1 Tax=Streptomyces sp. NBC_01618 TaxID=2975900 RepID=UPI003865A07D|nr:RHS repeat-associated core domain-containing protein [Streptomyces sp. NBC_01618]